MTTEFDVIKTTFKNVADSSVDRTLTENLVLKQLTVLSHPYVNGTLSSLAQNHALTGIPIHVPNTYPDPLHTDDPAKVTSLNKIFIQSKVPQLYFYPTGIVNGVPYCACVNFGSAYTGSLVNAANVFIF